MILMHIIIDFELNERVITITSDWKLLLLVYRYFY